MLEKVIVDVILGLLGFAIGYAAKLIREKKIKLPPLVQSYLDKLGPQVLIDAFNMGKNAAGDNEARRLVAVTFLRDIARLRGIELPDSVANMLIELAVSQSKKF